MRKPLLSYNWWLSGGNNAYVDAWLRELDEEAIARPDSNTIRELNRFFNSIATIVPKADRLKMTLAGVDGQETVDFINPTARKASYPAGFTDKAINGWKGDGVAEYVQLGFNPSTEGVNYQRDSATRLVYVEEAPTVGDRLEGTILSADLMRSISTTGQRINQGTTALNAATAFTLTGMKALRRIDATNVVSNSNEVQNARTATSAARSNSEFALHRALTSYGNGRISMHAILGYITDEELTTFTTAYAALRIGVGLILIAGSLIVAAGSELHTAGGEFL